MIDRDTFLKVKDWFIVCLQQGRDGTTFDNVLLYRIFNIYQDLIDFLDEINGTRFVQRRSVGLCEREVWEINALDSILEEAKKFEILKNVRRDASVTYKHELIQELIEKMKTNRPCCMIVCNFLANSKLSETPERYNNLCVLCKYCAECKKVLENNYRFNRQFLRF